MVVLFESLMEANTGKNQIKQVTRCNISPPQFLFVSRNSFIQKQQSEIRLKPEIVGILFLNLLVFY